MVAHSAKQAQYDMIKATIDQKIAKRLQKKAIENCQRKKNAA